jgi:DSF synthase
MSPLHAVPFPSRSTETERQYSQLTTHFDEQHQIAWGYMHSGPRPCFNPTLLSELLDWCGTVAQQIDDPNRPDVLYQVTASSVPGVFNLGGDLMLFREHIAARDRDGLYRYALNCIEPLYLNAVHLNRPNLKSICLVQGDALGGGFECALSGNVLVAEKGCRMGFPEILFNLFPGMGALTLLGRRVGMAKAERMILTGNLYSAEELFDMGVVDVLAEPGEGAKAVYDYVRRESRARNGTLALRAAREVVEPVSYEEIRRVTELWVDAAMNLEQKDLRMMERLIARQGQKGVQEDQGSVAVGARLAG